MLQPISTNGTGKLAGQAVAKNDFLSLAGIVEGKDSMRRVQKRDPHGDALRTAADSYQQRDYVAAYIAFKPVYEKVVPDMQRLLARNPEFEANKIAKAHGKSLAEAKATVQNTKANAQQVHDQFERLRSDLESRPMVRAFLRNGGMAVPGPPPSEEAPPTIVNGASETQVGPVRVSTEIQCGDVRFIKRPYSPPEVGSVYSVRDKTQAERVIRVVAKSPDGQQVQVVTIENGQPSLKPILLTIEAIVQQAAKGKCSLLVQVDEDETVPSEVVNEAAASNPNPNAMMRLDIQNFGRCCADIARAKINYSTQLIKDVGDGPFRAGNYEKAFQIFEQLTIGFNAAVAASRRGIEDGRRTLTAEKANLSGKEVQERTAGFIRSEQLIHTAEREFSTILEGLRMHLAAAQG